MALCIEGLTSKETAVDTDRYMHYNIG